MALPSISLDPLMVPLASDNIGLDSSSQAHIIKSSLKKTGSTGPRKTVQFSDYNTIWEQRSVSAPLDQRQREIDPMDWEVLEAAFEERTFTGTTPELVQLISAQYQQIRGKAKDLLDYAKFQESQRSKEKYREREKISLLSGHLAHEKEEVTKLKACTKELIEINSKYAAQEKVIRENDAKWVKAEKHYLGKMKELEGQVKSKDEALVQGQKRARDWETEGEDLKRKIQRRDTQLQEADAKIQRRDTKLQEAGASIDKWMQAEKRWNDIEVLMKKTLQESETDRDEALQRAKECEEKLKEAQAALAKAEAQHVEAEAKAQSLAQVFTECKAKFEKVLNPSDVQS